MMILPKLNAIIAFYFYKIKKIFYFLLNLIFTIPIVAAQGRGRFIEKIALSLERTVCATVFCIRTYTGDEVQYYTHVLPGLRHIDRLSATTCHELVVVVKSFKLLLRRWSAGSLTRQCHPNRSRATCRAFDYYLLVASHA